MSKLDPETLYYPLKSDIDTLAIEQLVKSNLLTAVDEYFLHERVIQQPQSVPIYRAKDYSRVLYISSVAFVLSKTLNIPPLEIAVAIAAHFRAAPIDITATVVTPGYLHLEPTAFGLANWLQTLPFLPRLLAKSTPNEYFSPIVNNSRLFYIQHAHARCCSFLRQAERAGTIALIKIEVQDKLCHWAIAQPLPWLNERSGLRFCHQSEYALISELVEVCDRIYTFSGDERRFWQAAANLSQAFTNFHSYCRLWGEVKQLDPQLVQARLGLILAVQVVLQFLLTTHLKAFAPQEL